MDPSTQHLVLGKTPLEDKDEVINDTLNLHPAPSPPKYLTETQAAGNTYLFGLLTPRSAKKKNKTKPSKHRIINLNINILLQFCVSSAVRKIYKPKTAAKIVSLGENRVSTSIQEK